VRALVTGASGFIGSHLVDRLIAEGHTVTALIRESSRLRWLKNKPVKLVTGDVRQLESLQMAVEFQDVIFHVAGAILSPNTRGFEQTNHFGSENMMEAIMTYNPDVQKVVYVSSLAAGGPTLPERPIKESDDPNPISAYGRTKLAGEEVVLSYADRLNVVVIRPPVVYGPRDRGVLNFFRLVAKGVKLNLGFRERYLSIIHVTDLVTALILAGLNQDSSGSYYVDDGTSGWTWLDLQHHIANAMETTARTFRIPLTPLFIYAALSTASQRFFHSRGWINLDKFREMVQQAWLCDSSRIQNQLGYQPSVSIEKGMKNTAEWYREIGWL